MGVASLSYAGFSRRAAAYFVDHTIIVTFNVVMLVIFVVTMTILNPEFQLKALLLHEIYGASIAAWIWTVAEPGFVTAYYVFHWRIFGATPGQWLFDVQIVGLDLAPLSLSQALLRWIGFIACTFTAGLGFLWSLFDARQQGIHDKLARTIAVRRSELVELQLLAEAEVDFQEEELMVLQEQVEKYDPSTPA